MSPDHESSYYEIALTNRQVLTIFVVLLTCLVAAFLSGVWIGQRDGAEAAQMVAVGGPEGGPDAAELAELKFFSDPPPLPRAVEKEPAGRASPPPASGPEAPAPSQPPAPRPQSSQPAVPQSGAPAAATPRPQPAPPREAGAAAPSADSARPVIQVFSTADVSQARRLIQRLGAGGYPAFLLQESLQGQTMYRVRVGPYREQTEAERIADKLRREFRLDTWITTQQQG